MTQKQIVVLRGLWESYIPSIKMTDVKRFELWCGNRYLWTDKWTETDRHTDRQTDRQTVP